MGCWVGCQDYRYNIEIRVKELIGWGLGGRGWVGHCVCVWGGGGVGGVGGGGGGGGRGSTAYMSGHAYVPPNRSRFSNLSFTAPIFLMVTSPPTLFPNFSYGDTGPQLVNSSIDTQLNQRIGRYYPFYIA